MALPLNGSLFEDIPLPTTIPKTRRSGGGVARAKRQLSPTERGCDHCPLRETWPRLTSPRMPACGNTDDPDILVLGEGPGEEEDAEGEVFIGKSGKLLRQFIPGRFRDRLAFQNAVRCRPDDNQTPDAAELHACSIHVDADIKQLGVGYILGVGGVPLSRFVRGKTASILAIHGVRFPVEINGETLWYYPVMHPSFVMRMGDSNEGRGEGPAMPVFRADMKRFFAEVDSWPRPVITPMSPKDVLLPRTRDEAEALLAKMHAPVGLDLETSSPHPDRVPKPYMIGAKLVSAAISDGKTTFAFAVDGNEWGLDFLLQIAEEHEWIAQNASYELAWLIYMSQTMRRNRPLKRCQDTMALARIYHQRETLLSLAAISRIHLGVDVKQIMEINTTRLDAYPIEEVLQYNGLDALATALIHRKLHKRVDPMLYEQIMGRTYSVVDMELAGLPVSIEVAEKLAVKWKAKADEAEEAAKKLHEVRAYEAAAQVAFSISKPAQVGEALVLHGKINLPKTEKGKQYNTKDEILNAECPDHPLAKAVLSWREATKVRSTYTLCVIEVPTIYKDGMLHPGYNTMLVSTFRLSSDDPNIQNWPKRSAATREVRSMIEVPEGYVLVPMDQGQIQVRIIAMASGDKKLIKNLVEGHDTHTDWLNNTIDIYPDYIDRLAQKVGEKDEKKIRKYGRNIIKTDFVFYSLFGGGYKGIARTTGIPERLSRELQGEFFLEFKGVKDWQNRQRKQYADTGSITGLSGETRHAILWGNEPLNTPIQMGEAQIVLEAQAELATKARETGDKHYLPRISVHDDLTFILPDDNRLMGYIEEIAEVMLKVRYDWQICPLSLEVQLGTNWADLTEVHTFTGDYMR